MPNAKRIFTDPEPDHFQAQLLHGRSREAWYGEAAVLARLDKLEDAVWARDPEGAPNGLPRRVDELQAALEIMQGEMHSLAQQLQAERERLARLEAAHCAEGSGFGDESQLGELDRVMPDKELQDSQKVEQLASQLFGAVKVDNFAANREPLRSLERILLGEGSLCCQLLGPLQPVFQDVCVFGPHHCGTCAVARELSRFFDVAVRNAKSGDDPSLWKHKVFHQAPPVSDDTFCICLVKDPAFWIQSLGRNVEDGTFYDVEPAQVVVTKDKVEVVAVQAFSRDQLFETVFFDGEVYADAICLWETQVRSYFLEEVFPAERTAVVRYEDFLFDFDAVVQALARRGLPLREALPVEPLNETAKDDSHPACTRRSRSELLEYYGDPANRLTGLTPQQVERLKCADPGIMSPLGYVESTDC